MRGVEYGSSFFFFFAGARLARLGFSTGSTGGRRARELAQLVLEGERFSRRKTSALPLSTCPASESLKWPSGTGIGLDS